MHSFIVLKSCLDVFVKWIDEFLIEAT